MTKVIQLTSVHTWNDIRIFCKISRSLVEAGYHVHIVAADRPVSSGSQIETFIKDGVHVHRFAKPKNRLVRFLKTTREILSYGASLAGDIYHFHDPEFLPKIRQFYFHIGTPIIYDVHEDVRADVLSKAYLPNSLKKSLAWYAGRVEDRIVGMLPGVIAATPFIACRFQGHSGLEVVQNFPLESEFEVGTSRGEYTSGRFVYIGGSLIALRGIEEAIKAIDIVGAGASLSLAGRWPSTVYHRHCVSLAGWKKTIDHGFLSRLDMLSLLAQSQAALILFHPHPNHVHAQPNKLFESMAAGLPVIASDFPLWRKIIDEYQCGILVNPQSPREIADAMRWILLNPQKALKMGENGRVAVREHFHWNSQFCKLEALYQRLLRTH